MKRILNACLMQEVRFDTMNDNDPQKDLEKDCHNMDVKKVQYVIDEQKNMPDGSIIIKVRKQYNSYTMNGYID